jgi:hypothetical protein
MITQIIFGEENRSLSYSLCSFLHSPATPSVLDSNILLCTILSNTLYVPPSMSAHQVSHPYKQAKL